MIFSGRPKIVILRGEMIAFSWLQKVQESTAGDFRSKPGRWPLAKNAIAGDHAPRVKRFFNSADRSKTAAPARNVSRSHAQIRQRQFISSHIQRRRRIRRPWRRRLFDPLQMRATQGRWADFRRRFGPIPVASAKRGCMAERTSTFGTPIFLVSSRSGNLGSLRNIYARERHSEHQHRDTQV